MIARQIWLLGYRLEDVRQQSAGRGQLWRQAAACIALAFLRLAGVRYV